MFHNSTFTLLFSVHFNSYTTICNNKLNGVRIICIPGLRVDVLYINSHANG